MPNLLIAMTCCLPSFFLFADPFARPDTARSTKAAAAKQQVAAQPKLQPLLPIGKIHSITSAAFSADGSWVVTGSDSTTAILWESASGTGVLSFRGHDG